MPSFKTIFMSGYGAPFLARNGLSHGSVRLDSYENLLKPSQYQLALFFGLPLRIRFATLETDPQLLLAEMIFVASYLAWFTLRSHLKFTRCLRNSRSTNYLWQQLISSYLWPSPGVTATGMPHRCRLGTAVCAAVPCFRP